MRISNEELLRIADLRKVSDFSETSSLGEPNVITALESLDMNRITEALSQVPDVREQIVASLKERIESGTYQVTGEQIAEMMVRRSLADRLR